MEMRDVVASFWRAIHRQQWDDLPGYFAPEGRVAWPNTGEVFSPREFAETNRAYPGDWKTEIRRLEQWDGGVVSVVRVFAEGHSLHAVSFFTFQDGKIAALEEYWSDDGPPPSWRQELFRRDR